jgi:hypothetical protein
MFHRSFIPVYFASAMTFQLLFGRYFAMRESSAPLYLALIMFVAPLVFWVILEFRFRYQYIACPNCGQPWVDPRDPKAPIASACWNCGFDVAKGTRGGDT